MALNKVPMSVEEGEIMRLIGPDDTGKKTSERRCNGIAGKKDLQNLYNLT